MNETRLNRTLLNRSVLNTTRLNATGIARKAKESVEDRVMKSLVLWYDLKKQGATNESMAADPRIIDHSGNGHHATCYNFAWAGKSGIGLYEVDCSTFNRTGVKYQINSGSKPQNLTLSYGNLAAKFDILPSFQAKITGIEGNNISSNYYYRDESGVEKIFPIKTDGTYTFPQSYVSIEGTGTSGGFSIKKSNEAPIEKDFSIEFLPIYPNALVSDGVDDYAMVNGLPIFTKERGYTVIADRTLDSARFNNSTFATKRTAGGKENGAFQFERGSSSVVSFGQANNVKYTLSGISYATSKEYNGKPIRIGDKEDTDKLTFCRLTTSVGAYGFMAMRSFLLFDRDLTAEEIEWVKSNMIGGDEQ